MELDFFYFFFIFWTAKPTYQLHFWLKVWCLYLVKVINYSRKGHWTIVRSTRAQPCSTSAWFYFTKWIQGHSSLISACSEDQIHKYFGLKTQFARYLLMLWLSPSARSFLLRNKPFKCCLSFTFSGEWKMFLRDPVSSCPFWRLELKALDGPIERSPIERSPTNRRQKAFRVINVVQTT